MHEVAKILVVDDQPDNLYVLERVLRGHGHEVELATDGPQALGRIAASRPDLVLLDVRMPGMDGFEVLRRLREQPETRTLPVVFLTANSPDLRAKIQALNLGADEYLTQPIQNSELLARVRALLRVKRFADQMEAANREKDEFISIVCHELKNPLAAIHAYSQLLDLRAKKDPALQHGLRGLEVIDRQVRRMVEMLNQLQDVASARRSGLSAELSPVDLAELLPRAVGEIRLGAHVNLASAATPGAAPTEPRRAVSLALEAASLPTRADESRIRQVLDNLIGNAIKYSPAGAPVEVRAGALHVGPKTPPGVGATPSQPPLPGPPPLRALPAPPPMANRPPGVGAWACVHVIDHGIGIGRDEQERLFERFYRGEGGKHMASGMGLGLYIVSQIIRLHGGHLWVTSEPDRGSTFSFALPLCL